MNEEQLKQLKPGDEIFIRARYKKILDDGDVLFLHTQTDLDDDVVKAEEYTLSENVILPSELQPAQKQDTCRLFKKGDKVKLREEVQGRKTSLFVTGLSLGKIYTVEHDEYNHTVAIIGDECLGRYSFVHLELVTPVEELEPYSIGKSDYNGFVNIEKKGKIIAMIPYGKELHEHKTREEAFAAAEAECARLNAAYRKDQS